MSVIFDNKPQSESKRESEFVENKLGIDYNVEDIRPVEDMGEGEALLNSLGIDDTIGNLDVDSKQNLLDVDGYVKKVMQEKGLTQTKSVYEKTVKSLMGKMGIDKDTEPSHALSRMAGIINGYRSISFITDASKRKEIFTKLIEMKSTKEMDNYIFNLMEENKVWQ